MSQCWNDAETAEYLVDDLMNPYGVPDLDLRNSIDEVLEHITVVSRAALSQLGALDTKSSEADVIYVDFERGAVYKTYHIQRGVVVNGITPGRLQRYRGKELAVSIDRDTPLLQFLHHIHIANRHGGSVFTEVCGFTEDGDLLTKQPYVTDLYRAPSKDVSNHLTRKGFKAIKNMPYAAAAEVDGKFYLYADIAGNNAMQTSAGDPFMIDATLRELSDDELMQLRL